ncbi:MAG: hypothetical protein KBG20_06305 [Caldilineaceae bacterium]|nr:hypothetical protein [Caldilineaceae bacterium]MBP8105972.1 hypothetical protein [Caldilineaceae bacterium]MBP8124912.1 hypothetical protein [Caldilineaceae bacterium]MBP9071892.1 hypothetical protein [Caldilineaceae bacterium]
MTPRNNTVSIIIVSLIFAVAIALSTYIFADTGYSQTIMYLLIALWFIPFTLLIRARNQKEE